MYQTPYHGIEEIKLLLLSNLEPVASDEISTGKSYILLSSAQEQIYLLKDCDIEFIKIFGRPPNYGMFSCNIEETYESVSQSVPFFKCGTQGMYKHAPKLDVIGDLAIDWSR